MEIIIYEEVGLICLYVCRNHDVDIALFALPGSILLQVPIVGPLAFFPIQASAAFLVDKLAREDSKFLPSEEASANPMPAPTLPKGVQPDQFTYPQDGRAPTLPKDPNPMLQKLSWENDRSPFLAKLCCNAASIGGQYLYMFCTAVILIFSPDTYRVGRTSSFSVSL